MNPHLYAAVAAERQRVLQRAAGCCIVAGGRFRRARAGIRVTLRGRVGRRQAAGAVCCA